MTCLIVGCGDIGLRVARLWMQGQRDDPRPPVGVVRSAESGERVRAAGMHARVLDLAESSLDGLPLADSRLFHFAPPSGGVEDLHTERLLAACARQGPPRRIVYISTTGVYGDCGGDWVDETWPVKPAAERSLRRWNAEQRLRAFVQRYGGELVILRVAGIYGPGRLPLERLRRGLPMVRPEEAPYSNRIHADDLAAACIAAMERGENGAVYNACDHAPSTMVDYFDRIADATGLPRPPRISLAEAAEQLSAGMMSYMRESRRLSNRKLREELGVTLRYPTLADGLPSCLEPPVGPHQ